MATVTVYPVMHPDRPVKVRDDEAAVLRARGLLVAAPAPPEPAGTGADGTATGAAPDQSTQRAAAKPRAAKPKAAAQRPASEGNTPS
jgi:hypothetical protein